MAKITTDDLCKRIEACKYEGEDSDVEEIMRAVAKYARQKVKAIESRENFDGYVVVFFDKRECGFSSIKLRFIDEREVDTNAKKLQRIEYFLSAQSAMCMSGFHIFDKNLKLVDHDWWQSGI